MKISDLIVSMLVMCGVVTGMLMFYSGMMKTYSPYQPNLTYVNELPGFNQTNEIIYYMDDMANRTQRVGEYFTQWNLLGAAIESTQAFLDVVQVLFRVPNIFFQLVTDSFRQLTGIYIPAWFVSTIVTIIVAIIVLKVVSLWFKGDI